MTVEKLISLLSKFDLRIRIGPYSVKTHIEVPNFRVLCRVNNKTEGWVTSQTPATDTLCEVCLERLEVLDGGAARTRSGRKRGEWYSVITKELEKRSISHEEVKVLGASSLPSDN